MGPGLRGGSRCSANSACTSSLEVPPASDLAKRTQSLEQQDMAQPWVVLEEEEGRRRRGPAVEGTSVMRIRVDVLELSKLIKFLS